MAAAFPPLVVNIERQATAEPHWRDVLRAREKAERSVLAVSLLHGFPYADVPEMGSAVVAVTDGDPDHAAAVARSVAGVWWDRRADFVGRLISPSEAVGRAAALDGPVCLLDMGDNVGGGSPGDGTVLAHELHRRRLGPSFVCLADPESVRVAAAAGVGNRLQIRTGGKTDALHGEPLELDVTVRGLFDGKFTESNPRHGGITSFDQGSTAVVESDGGLTLLLTTNRMVPFSLNQITSCGLDPVRFRVLVAKGVHAPAAAYAPVCKHLIRVDTPGVTSADLSRLTYRHRRRPMFPFEPETEWLRDG
jgi:microcystin degradation protein MlrC